MPDLFIEGNEPSSRVCFFSFFFCHYLLVFFRVCFFVVVFGFSLFLPFEPRTNPRHVAGPREVYVFTSKFTKIEL